MPGTHKDNNACDPPSATLLFSCSSDELVIHPLPHHRSYQSEMIHQSQVFKKPYIQKKQGLLTYSDFQLTYAFKYWLSTVWQGYKNKTQSLPFIDKKIERKKMLK